MSAELLAFHNTQTKSSTPHAAYAQTQQGFINERTSLDIPTIAHPSRTADDEQDDEMSEPTQMTSAEKRKVDESVKKLRASLAITASSHASSLRPDDAKNSTTPSKQARTKKTEVETLQDVSFSVSKKGIVSISRMDFFRVRMAGMRQSNKEKLLKNNNGGRNLHFASCPPEVQAAFTETRRAEWREWMSFNAGSYFDRGGASTHRSRLGDLSHAMDRSGQKRTSAKGQRLCFCSCKCTRVDWLVAETSRQRRDLAQNLQLVMWIRTILFAVGVRRLTFPFTRTISRTDTSKDKKLIESCCIVFRLEGIPEEGVASGAILASRVPIYGTKDAGRGLWVRLKSTCKKFNFSLNRILPTLFTLRNEESKIIAVMSSNVDDLLFSYLPEVAEATNSVLQQFLVGKEEHNTFRCCGKEFQQNEDFGIRVTAKDNTERVHPITYDAKQSLTPKATANEVRRLRSVTQSVAWTARPTRPDLSCRIPKIQSTFEILVLEACVSSIVV